MRTPPPPLTPPFFFFFFFFHIIINDIKIYLQLCHHCSFLFFSFYLFYFFFDNRDIAKLLFTLPKLLGKEKIDRIRRAMSQTGGGPPPPELTPAEQLIWKSMSERPVMTGLSVTIDTDGKHLFLSNLFNADN